MRSSRILTGAILLTLACSPAETPQTSDTGTTTASTSTAPPFRHNHYKGWKLDPAPKAGITVTITEPRAGITRPVELETVEYLFNPATKDHNGRQGNRDAALHYVAYSIKAFNTPGTFPVRNQFLSPATWSFTDREKSWLLVPALKKNPGVVPKEDHLFCYAVTGPKVAETVTVTDQFSVTRIAGLTPTHYCVPVSKQRDQSPVEGITHPRAYLTIYRYEPAEEYPAGVPVWDQFHEPEPLQLPRLRTERLAVPAWD